jgi:phytanoyl-CoA hydroxylase
MGSKLNMKSAQYGSPVEWHQDWAFYPHSNDDVLAIDVLLDDCDLENGQMMVTPRSHTSQSVWNHHGDDGCFAGLIDPQPDPGRDQPRSPLRGKSGQHVVPPRARPARLRDQHLEQAAQPRAL